MKQDFMIWVSYMINIYNIQMDITCASVGYNHTLMVEMFSVHVQQNQSMTTRLINIGLYIITTVYVPKK